MNPYSYYYEFLNGFWRCSGKDYVFDYYIRHDGFHIGVIPEQSHTGNKLIPLALWLTVESSSEIMIRTIKSGNSWSRDYYRDGNRLVMLDYMKPETRSISSKIKQSDISKETMKIILEYTNKYPVNSC